MIMNAFYSNNENWQNQLDELKQYAQSEHSIMLIGPSGSGKDVLARQVHAFSGRSSGPMISVNCAAIQESLVESELFGHKKGSFTGASTDRKGAFLSADKGTLFLDEIGDLSLSIQAKLLRCLENKKIKAVGEDKEKDIDVRIISATHKPIEKLVSEGGFRTDLFYRLNVINISVPALCERPEDIPSLTSRFAKEQNINFTDAALDLLKHQEWRGNIRELRNFVMKAACLQQSGPVTAEQVARLFLHQKVNSSSYETQRLTRNFIKQIERGLIMERLVANNWNQRRTAKDLGIPKSTLHDQIKRFGISKLSDM